MTPSHLVLKQAIAKKGVKIVASELKVSSSLIYKWCQEKDLDSGAGADNPLDRLNKLIAVTEDESPIHWLCQSSGGFYVPNPQEEQGSHSPVLGATQELVSEFSELLGAVSASFHNDGQIDESEAKQIRKEWEDLKSMAEQFVRSCERGVYANDESN